MAEPVAWGTLASEGMHGRGTILQVIINNHILSVNNDSTHTLGEQAKRSPNKRWECARMLACH